LQHVPHFYHGAPFKFFLPTTELLRSHAMSFFKKAIGGIESVVRDVSGNQDYHFGDFTKKAFGFPTHSDEEKRAALNDWVVLKDLATGRTYYQNNRLGITQWDPPVPLQSRHPQQHQLPIQQHHHPVREQSLPAGWQTLYDPTGRPYYANHVNQLTTYERPVPIASGGCFSTQPPPQFAAFPRGSGASEDAARVLVGAIKVSDALGMSEEEKRAHIGELGSKKKGLFGSQKVADGWEEMRDQQGRVFFHNNVTNEVSFIRPTVASPGVQGPTSDDLWDSFFTIAECAFD
jgi:hypothetical protein